VHRRLRLEAYAGYVHFTKSGVKAFPVNAQALNCSAAAQVNAAHGRYLLPMAFPEGSPIHPAYGAGHATVVGACIALLKAMFDENQIMPNPEFVDDSRVRQPWRGARLTVGGKRGKLALNVAIGRDIAGAHWRSDATASLRRGEQIAISLLRDHKLMLNESLGGSNLTTLGGAQITILSTPVVRCGMGQANRRTAVIAAGPPDQMCRGPFRMRRLRSP